MRCRAAELKSVTLEGSLAGVLGYSIRVSCNVNNMSALLSKGGDT